MVLVSEKIISDTLKKGNEQQLLNIACPPPIKMKSNNEGVTTASPANLKIDDFFETVPLYPSQCGLFFILSTCLK
jgi:hypothetical protein